MICTTFVSSHPIGWDRATPFGTFTFQPLSVRALYAVRCGQNEEIYIGQGWQEQPLDGLGIGRCCRGAAKCVMGCPPTAEAIAQKLEEMRWS